MRKLILLLLAIGLLGPAVTQAGIYGILKGKVFDQDGKPVIGASVFIEGTKRGTYVKEKDGSFTIVNVSPGNYTVRVRSVGYKETKVKIRISADDKTNINVKLVSEDIQTDELVVTADRIMVDKNSIGSMDKLDNEQLTSSVSDNVQSIVGQSAGVVNSGGGFLIRGSRSDESQIRVDGYDVGNQFTGSFGATGRGNYPMVSAYATEEVQVIKGGFGAEYGHATGGIVNTVVKTGSTEGYEGFIRWERPLGFLYSSQPKGMDVVREGTNLTLVERGEGVDLLASNRNNFEAGFGGPLPLPFLNNSTFYLSASYRFTTQYGGYDVQDPAGNTLSQLPGQGTWVKNLTGRMKFSVTQDINLIIGGSYGLTNLQSNSWGWSYADDPARFFDTNSTGDITERIVDIPEYAAKNIVWNQFVVNIYTKINHTLNDHSFYEFSLSTNENSDDGARRIGYDDPNFFTGFDIYEPKDQLKLSNDGTHLVPGVDKIVDWYQRPYTIQQTEDGYLSGALPALNPLTGYFEGSSNTTGTDNAYGISNYFVTHGNGGFQFRRGTYFQVDGSYTNIFETGDFEHTLKTGFEVRLYNNGRHYNGNPYDAGPFYDVYMDDFGGNLYSLDDEVKEKTNKSFKPFRWSAFLQDQVEYKDILISPGLRIDYFNPNSDYRTMEENTFVGITADSGFAAASAKMQISPRINVTYPITDRSLIRIIYGLYFKMPNLQQMYDTFNKELLRGNDIVGNPNMEAQRTNQYEVTYSNQLTDDFVLDVTAYYKDIYNQLGIMYVAVVPQPFYMYTVADYGNSRGVELGFRKRRSDNFSFSVNYTLAFAEGTSSSPGQNYMPPIDPYTKQLTFPLAAYPLSFDIRHNLKITAEVFWGNNDGPSIGGIQPLENTNINLQSTFRTGAPYTRTDLGGSPISEYNAERLPSIWTLNLRIAKTFLMQDYFGEGAGNSSLSFFLDVYNLLDRFVATSVFAATGDADNDGVLLSRKPGYFNAEPYYKEADFSVPQTIDTRQYDDFGNRKYNEIADKDGNGIVTQQEKFDGYIEIVRTNKAFRGNYSSPRTVSLGIMFNF